ncbi:SDR family oxidoreductase [Sphingomonas sp. Leaf25]|uniref:SDR family oxidoreductase n=1 Tax=Sphingomonas sp. Leaf25 TaxID=1735692 RepID=UPI0006F51C12|nr:SDR family oxidoreductase [Sphingomonas sp. Leaf25]KQM97732.1 short-chain dehydrogenase [Sphingomonas sp. Leaf25]
MARSIFITGGASGIGRATAQLFAARGWRIGLADIDAATLTRTAGDLPADTATFAFDVTQAAGWDAALAAFVADGAIDVVFNNAGIAAGGVFADMAVTAIERTVAVNLTGVLLGAHAAHPYLKASGGCLLNTASAAGIYGTAGAAVYSATKFAVRGLTEALDGEWAADGIAVRALMPGFIDTPLLDGTLTGTNRTIRERVREQGLEFTSLETVAQAAWDAVHGGPVLVPVGPTARRMRFAARWFPNALRKQMRARR